MEEALSQVRRDHADAVRGLEAELTALKAELASTTDRDQAAKIVTNGEAETRSTEVVDGTIVAAELKLEGKQNFELDELRSANCALREACDSLRSELDTKEEAALIELPTLSQLSSNQVSFGPTDN